MDQNPNDCSRRSVNAYLMINGAIYLLIFLSLWLEDESSRPLLVQILASVGIGVNSVMTAIVAKQ